MEIRILIVVFLLTLKGMDCQFRFNPYNMLGRGAGVAITSNGNGYQQLQYGQGGAAAAATSNNGGYQQYQFGSGAAAAAATGYPYQQYQYGVQQQMPLIQQQQQQQPLFQQQQQGSFMGMGGMTSLLNFANQIGGQALQNPQNYNIISGNQDNKDQLLSKLDSDDDEQQPDYQDLDEDSLQRQRNVIASASATAINGFNQNQFNADPNIPQFNSNSNTVLSKAKINQDISPTFNDNKSLQQSVQQNAYIGNNYIYKEIKNQVAPGPPNVYGDGGIYQKLYGEGGLYSTIYAGYQAPSLPSEKRPC